MRKSLFCLALLAAIASIGCGIQLPPCLVAGTCLPTPPVASPTPPVIQPTPAPAPTPTSCPAGQVLVPVTGFGGGGVICTTPPAAACVIPDGIEGKDVSRSTLPAADVVVAQVNAAAAKVAGCPNDPVSRCVVTPQTSLEFRQAVVAAIKAAGGCAGIQVDSDEVLVLISPGLGQGVHIYDSGRDATHGTVAWAPGSVKDTWTAITSTPSPVPPTGIPTPPPPPAPTCPSLGRIVLAVRQQARLLVDATPQTSDKDWCNANGFAGRNNCPMGAEGGASRPVCEAAAGPYVWTVAGGDFFNNDNPLQIVVTSHPPGAPVQVCGKGACSDPVALP